MMKKTNKIKMLSMDSTNIDAIGYDKETQTLEIHFLSGGKYQYNPVPEQTWKAFNIAKSVGSFFFKYIKSNATLKVTQL